MTKKEKKERIEVILNWFRPFNKNVEIRHDQVNGKWYAMFVVGVYKTQVTPYLPLEELTTYLSGMLHSDVFWNQIKG